MYKICGTCKKEKFFCDFNRDKSKKDGHCTKCKLCVKEYQKTNKKKLAVQRNKYREINKEKTAEQQAAYRVANKDKIATLKTKHYHANKKKLTEYAKEHRKANKAVYAAHAAKRRAKRLQATPSWLTEEDFIQITEFYSITQMFKLYTGQEYHVDHIVPLQGKNVCGLHVPWNLQVLPAKENISKSNKLGE